MKKSIAPLALVTTLLAAGPVFADATPANTSTTKARSSLLDRLSLSYTNVFYGPSVENWDMKYMPDYGPGGSDKTSPLMSKNYLSLGYKVNNNLTVSGTFYTYSYYANQIKDGAIKRGPGFKLADSYIKVQIPKAYHNGNFNLAVDYRLAFGLSDGSNAASRIGYVASKQLSTYALQGTKLSFGFSTYEELHAYGDRHKAIAASKGNYDIDLYFGPEADYQIAPNLNSALLFELETHRKVMAHGMEFATNYMDIEPSVSWDINKRINLNPFLNIPTYQEGASTRINLKNTTINAVLSLKLL